MKSSFHLIMCVGYEIKAMKLQSSISHFLTQASTHNAKLSIFLTSQSFANDFLTRLQRIRIFIH